MMEVTTELQNSLQTYGGSDSTNPSSTSSSKSLVYSQGSSWQKPIVDKVTVAPYTFNYSGEVGLFGCENIFVRLDCKILDAGGGVLIVNDYIAGDIQTTVATQENTFNSAIFNASTDFSPVNDFEPASVESDFVNNLKSIVKIELVNEKAGNKYENAWVDIRLYDRYRTEIPQGTVDHSLPLRETYDDNNVGQALYSEDLNTYTKSAKTTTLYIYATDSIYIGVHARNTKRLPYKFKVKVSNLTEPDVLNDEERKLLANYI